MPFGSGGSVDDKQQIAGDSAQVNSSDVFCKHIATDYPQFQKPPNHLQNKGQY